MNYSQIISSCPYVGLKEHYSLASRALLNAGK